MPGRWGGFGSWESLTGRASIEGLAVAVIRFGPSARLQREQCIRGQVEAVHSFFWFTLPRLLWILDGLSYAYRWQLPYSPDPDQVLAERIAEESIRWVVHSLTLSAGLTSSEAAEHFETIARDFRKDSARWVDRPALIEVQAPTPRVG